MNGGAIADINKEGEVCHGARGRDLGSLTEFLEDRHAAFDHGSDVLARG
jgi:hypothetical protein